MNPNKVNILNSFLVSQMYGISYRSRHPAIQQFLLAAFVYIYIEIACKEHKLFTSTTSFNIWTYFKYYFWNHENRQTRLTIPPATQAIYTASPGRRSNEYSVLTQRQISENICSEDDLRSAIFGTFVVKFPIYSLKTKIRLTMLCLSGFQLCSPCHERPCFVIMDFILAYTSDSAPLSWCRASWKFSLSIHATLRKEPAGKDLFLSHHDQPKKNLIPVRKR